MFGKRKRSEADLGILEAEIRKGDLSETLIPLSNSPTGPAINKFKTTSLFSYLFCFLLFHPNLLSIFQHHLLLCLRLLRL